MSTFAFGDFTVTTWGLTPDGQQRWRIRTAGDRVVELLAPRDTEVVELYDLCRAALNYRWEGDGNL